MSTCMKRTICHSAAFPPDPSDAHATAAGASASTTDRHTDTQTEPFGNSVFFSENPSLPWANGATVGLCQNVRRGLVMFADLRGQTAPLVSLRVHCRVSAAAIFSPCMRTGGRSDLQIVTVMLRGGIT